MNGNILEALNTSISDIEKKYKRGLRNTSIRRFDALSAILSDYAGIKSEELKIISAEKASNAWNRFAEGRAVHHHFKLGVAIITGAAPKSALSPVRAFIGHGKGRYECIAIVSKEKGKWIVSHLVSNASQQFVSLIKKDVPTVEVHVIGDVFCDLEKKFTRWLPKTGVKSAVAKYVRSLKAVGLPFNGVPKTKCGKFDGLCEFLLGKEKKPAKGVFDVAGLADFERNYGGIKKFLLAERREDCLDYDAQKLADWFDYFHASPDKKSVAKKDSRFTINAYAKYLKFLAELESSFGGVIGEMLKGFAESLAEMGLCYEDVFVRRFVAALLAKPFVILTGLSGSGKTKLAEAFTRWLCGNDPNRCKLVAVGADWTNSEKLLGYPNALKLSEKKYVMPDTGVLKFLIEASKKENSKKPFFLILDEMNLSHVERYFADFLSTMESVDGEIHLYDGADIDDEGTWFSAEDGTKIPPQIKFPRNLFVIGTMNVDETTYMFSPKVLDRAQVVEFCVDQTDLARYFASEKKRLDFEQFVDGRGEEYAEDFLLKAYEVHPFNSDAQTALTLLFPKLKKLGAEFGFRTAGEFSDFVTIYESLGGDSESAVDAAIAQKILPKLHGSQGMFGEVIDELLMFARPPKENALEEQAKEDAARAEGLPAPTSGKYDVRYPLTAEKLERMQIRLRDNGFASFAEA